MNYPKIIVALIEHFIANEGTDYLGQKGEPEDSYGSFGSLTTEERGELGRLRDEARGRSGWHGYD